MPRFTLASIHDKLETIESEIKELKQTKVGSEIWQIQYEQIKDDISDVKAEIAQWRFYVKWAVLLIFGGIITALMGLIIK